MRLWVAVAVMFFQIAPVFAATAQVNNLKLLTITYPISDFADSLSKNCVVFQQKKEFMELRGGKPFTYAHPAFPVVTPGYIQCIVGTYPMVHDYLVYQPSVKDVTLRDDAVLAGMVKTTDEGTTITGRLTYTPPTEIQESDVATQVTYFKEHVLPVLGTELKYQLLVSEP